MKKRRTHAGSIAIAAHIRPFAGRARLAVMIAGAFIFILAGKSQNETLSSLRMQIADATAPVIAALASPVDAIASVGDWVRETVALRAENRALREENMQLKAWQEQARLAATENQELRALLQFAPAETLTRRGARLSMGYHNGFSAYATLGAGTEDGIRPDLAVMAADGLIGRVAETGDNSARVMLLSDINSRIPVIGEQSHEKAIAAGNGSTTLSLLYLPERSQLKEGETLVTSGDEGTLPAGLPVGVVTAAGKDGVFLRPYADPRRVSQAQVLDREQ